MTDGVRPVAQGRGGLPPRGWRRFHAGFMPVSCRFHAGFMPVSQGSGLASLLLAVGDAAKEVKLLLLCVEVGEEGPVVTVM